MCNREHCALFEFRPNGRLNQCVRLVVHRCRRLVQHEHFRSAQQRSRETQQLSLSH